MGRISDRILKEIDRRGVEPAPAWRFTLSSALMWIGLAFFMASGSLSVSVIISLVADNDWSGIEHFRGGPAGFLFFSLPYIWLALAAVLLVAAYKDFRRTEGGHRYRTAGIIGVAVVLSVAGGGILHAAGVGERTDAMLARGLPHYRQAVVRGAELWNEPEEGRLMGRVESAVSESEFEIDDIAGERWSVRVRGASAPTSSVPEGAYIRAIGEVTGDREFSADRVLPWRPMRMMKPRPTPGGITPPCPAYNGQERSMRPMVHPVAENRLNDPGL